MFAFKGGIIFLINDRKIFFRSSRLQPENKFQKEKNISLASKLKIKTDNSLKTRF